MPRPENIETPKDVTAQIAQGGRQKSQNAGIEPESIHTMALQRIWKGDCHGSNSRHHSQIRQHHLS